MHELGHYRKGNAMSGKKIMILKYIDNTDCKDWLIFNPLQIAEIAIAGPRLQRNIGTIVISIGLLLTLLEIIQLSQWIFIAFNLFISWSINFLNYKFPDGTATDYYWAKHSNEFLESKR